MGEKSSLSPHLKILFSLDKMSLNPVNLNLGFLSNYVNNTND